MKKTGSDLQANEVITALKAGQPGMIEALYDRHRPAFLVWARRRFQGTSGDIEDAWQEAVAVFYDQVMSGRLTVLTCSVKTFLFAVANNWMLKNERKLKRIWWKDEMDEALLAHPGLHTAAVDDLWEEERLVLQKAMTELSAQCREMLTQRHYHDRSITELMEAYQYANKNTVNATLAGCLSKLKQIIKEKTKK